MGDDGSKHQNECVIGHSRGLSGGRSMFAFIKGIVDKLNSGKEVVIMSRNGIKRTTAILKDIGIKVSVENHANTFYFLKKIK